MTRNKAIAAYLIGLPALGGVFGLLSYVAYRLINGNDSTFVFVMMMAAVFFKVVVTIDRFKRPVFLTL